MLEKKVLCDEFVFPRELFDTHESYKGISMNKKDDKLLVKPKSGASRGKGTELLKRKRISILHAKPKLTHSPK